MMINVNLFPPGHVFKLHNVVLSCIPMPALHIDEAMMRVDKRERLDDVVEPVVDLVESGH